MTLPSLEPITDADLPAFCRFLTEHLSSQRSPEAWSRAFQQPWYKDKPNNGFLIRQNGRIVGGIGAIYAQRPIHGRLERFCNITSWCVLDQFRAQSMRLAMAVAAQPGFHYTDFTPTEVVSKTLQFLKFKPMNERQAVWPNLPLPFGLVTAVRVVTDPALIARLLSPEDASAYHDHKHLPWLSHLAAGTGNRWCHVVWKRSRLKGIAGAAILSVSDPKLFLRCRSAIGSYLLSRHALPYTRMESRLLPEVPRGCIELAGYRSKVFKSDTLQPQDMSNLYSEIVALDL
jgi:hypothetical protein